MNLKRVRLIKAALLLVPMLLPLFVQNQYYIHGLLGRIFIYTILVTSLDIVVGYLGDISIGHAGLFAIGAYSVAILTANPAANEGSTMHFLPQLPFLVALALGVIAASAAGFMLGFPSLRASGPYLAVTTIAYGLIISTFINEQEFLTNGTKGIHLTPLQLGALSFDGNHFIWIVYPAMILVMYLVNNLAHSFWGRAFEAIKFSSIAAECSGVWRTRIKIIAFVFSSAIAGLAGGLFTQLDHYIAASTFTLDFSIIALIALIFGGIRSALGNFIGMVLVVLLPDLFVWFKDYRLMVFGILLMLTLFFLPKGIAGSLRLVAARFMKSDEEAELQAQLDELRKAAALDKSPLFPAPRATQSPALSFKSVEMRFGGLIAVNDLSFEVKCGSIHGLMGPNGSGKSTCVNLTSGLYFPSRGQVSLLGQEITRLKPYRRSKAGIARTFQNLQLFSELTVLDNVLVGLHSSFRSQFWDVLLGLPHVRKEEKLLQARALRLLQFVGLEKQAFARADSLAYGQARRLEIARALASQPALLLLDEPAAGLTSAEIQEFNSIFKQVKAAGISVLLIEHHMDMLMAISDEITVIDFGKKIASGAPSEIQKNPEVIRAYLGVADPC